VSKWNASRSQTLSDSNIK